MCKMRCNHSKSVNSLAYLGHLLLDFGLESNSHVKFIVDEDSARAGKEFLPGPCTSEVPI